MPATHFITAKTFHRKRLFQNQRYGELFTHTLMCWRERHALSLHGYVVMPDHVHLLFTTASGDSLGQVLDLERAFARELANQFGYDGEVWDGKIRDESVADAAECDKCFRMIESNPVRVGFCEKPGHYAMSSVSSRWVLDPLPEKLRKAELLVV